MLGGTWLATVQITELLSIFLTIPANVALLYCIHCKSPKQFGNYRHYMAFFCYQSVWFSVVSLVISSNYFGCRHSVATFSTRNLLNLSNTGMSILLCIGGSSACMLFCSLATQFLYRLCAMTKNSYLHCFNDHRWIYWYIGIILVSISSGCNIYAFGPMLESSRRDNFTKELRETFEIPESQELYIVRLALYTSRPGLRKEMQMDKSIIGFFLLVWITMVPFLIIIYCGVRIYQHTSVETSKLSNHMKLQKQLFHALLIQSLAPGAFLFIPICAFFIFPFLGQDLGVISDLGGITFVIYPIVDPLAVLYVIKQYREFVYKCICAPWKVGPQVEDQRDEEFDDRNVVEFSQFGA